MTMLHGFSQTDNKVELSKYWMPSISFQENKKKKAMRGQEVKAAAWRRWNVRVHYWGSGGGEWEELTLSKLVNRLGSHGAWWGEEGAKGSGTESLAGREGNSPEPWALNRPGLWNDSDDSDRSMLDRLPSRTYTLQQNSLKYNRNVNPNHIGFILRKHTEQEPAHLGVEVEVWWVFRFWEVMLEEHLTECPPYINSCLYLSRMDRCH